MYKTIISLSFLFSSFMLFSQVEDSIRVIDKSIPNVEEEIFYMSEDPPQFPGGEKARNKYLRESIVYPELEKDSNIQGKVVVNFIVEKDGSLSNIKILKSVSENIDKEAIRVIYNMPKWIPGKQRGKPVRVYVNLLMRFTLN